MPWKQGHDFDDGNDDPHTPTLPLHVFQGDGDDVTLCPDDST